MRRRLFLLLAFTLGVLAGAAKVSPTVVSLMDRIDPSGSLSRRVVTDVKPGLARDGRDVFRLTNRRGRPCVEGSSVLAVTAGLNWYLNHHAHVNLTWNQLSADLSAVAMPLVARDEERVCEADYRYYLNYCTFGYSMSTWTWARWEQEIDWMALHGINMPLQIVGLEEVWLRTLRQRGYTAEAAKRFVAGPAFTAWWGMNNLEGWGGTQDDAWYRRQTELARRICDRERELGMQPVLPGFSGMVPSGSEGAESQGKWCGFQRPYIMDPTDATFDSYAADYYRNLHDVMGPSRYYSMDPFHEGGSIKSGKYAEGYRALFDAMDRNCGADSKWVIQQWQWAPYQGESLTAVPAGRLIVLDLFSDGKPDFDKYNGYAPQEAIYCAIPNFGGRTGFMGRLPKMADNYARYRAQYPTLRGVGVAPEAIEQTPVAYDLLFELPWQAAEPESALPSAVKPAGRGKACGGKSALTDLGFGTGRKGSHAVDTHRWMADYVRARYGLSAAVASSSAELAEALRLATRAWERLRLTALNNTTSLQGPHEAVMCARPGLSIDRVSTWGGSEVFYSPDEVILAARDLHAAASLMATAGAPAFGRSNMSYDLCDITRQALSDYSKRLLGGIREAHEAGDNPTFVTRRDLFLQLILDTDRLLGTNRMFRLGNWTETARQAAAEIAGATTATPDWYELDNARTLITTWGERESSDRRGLHDYSYRQWQGLLRDYYYERWRYWFYHGMEEPAGGWFVSEWNWAHDLDAEWGAEAIGTQRRATPRRYSPEPEGDTHTVAGELLGRYFGLSGGNDEPRDRGL